MRPEVDICKDNETLDAVIKHQTPEQAIAWLRGAYHGHKDQIHAVLEKYHRLQHLMLKRVNAPLSVEEAQLLDVCRICHHPRKGTGSFILNYGTEYAHDACLSSSRASAK